MHSADGRVERRVSPPLKEASSPGPPRLALTADEMVAMWQFAGADEARFRELFSFVAGLPNAPRPAVIGLPLAFHRQAFTGGGQ